jgi:hypothetical protein
MVVVIPTFIGEQRNPVKVCPNGGDGFSHKYLIGGSASASHPTPTSTCRFQAYEER